MSMWQLFAMLDDNDNAKGLSEAEVDDIWEWMTDKNGD